METNPPLEPYELGHFSGAILRSHNHYKNRRGLSVEGQVDIGGQQLFVTLVIT